MVFEQIIPRNVLPLWETADNVPTLEEGQVFQDSDNDLTLPASMECDRWVRVQDMEKVRREIEAAARAAANPVEETGADKVNVEEQKAEEVNGDENKDENGDENKDENGDENKDVNENEVGNEDNSAAEGKEEDADKIVYAVCKPAVISKRIVRLIPRKLTTRNATAALIASQMELIGNHPQLVPAGSFLWEAIEGGEMSSANGLPTLSASGRYSVRLFVAGAWRRVVVDDRMPIDKDGECLFPTSSDRGEIWPMLLTKALFKVADMKRSDTNLEDATCIDTLRRFTGWMIEPYKLGPYPNDIARQLVETGYPSSEKVGVPNENKTPKEISNVPRLLCMNCVHDGKGLRKGQFYGVARLKQEEIRIQADINYKRWREEVRRAFLTLDVIDGSDGEVLQTELAEMLHTDDMRLALEASCLAKENSLAHLDISAQSSPDGTAGITWEGFIQMFDNLSIVANADIDVLFTETLEHFSSDCFLVYCLDVVESSSEEETKESVGEVASEETEGNVPSNDSDGGKMKKLSFHWYWEKVGANESETDEVDVTKVVQLANGVNNARLEQGAVRQGLDSKAIEATSRGVLEAKFPMIYVDGGVSGTRLVVNFETDGTLLSVESKEKHIACLSLIEEGKDAAFREPTKARNGIFGSQRPSVAPLMKQLLCNRGASAALSLNVPPGGHFYRLAIDCDWGWELSLYSDASLLVGPVCTVLKDATKTMSLVENKGELSNENENEEWRIVCAQNFRVPEDGGTSVGATMHFDVPSVGQYARLSLVNQDTGISTTFSSLEMPIRELKANESGYSLLVVLSQGQKSNWRLSVISDKPLLDCKLVDMPNKTSLKAAYRPNKYCRLFRVALPAEGEETKRNVAIRLAVSNVNAFVRLDVIRPAKEEGENSSATVRDDGTVGDDLIVTSARGQGSVELLFVPGFEKSSNDLLVQGSVDLDRWEMPKAFVSEAPYWRVEETNDEEDGTAVKESLLDWTMTVYSEREEKLEHDMSRENRFESILSEWEKSSPGRADKASTNLNEIERETDGAEVQYIDVEDLNDGETELAIMPPNWFTERASNCEEVSSKSASAWTAVDAKNAAEKKERFVELKKLIGSEEEGNSGLLGKLKESANIYQGIKKERCKVLRNQS